MLYMSRKFSDAIDIIIVNTPALTKMPGSGLNAFLDDLIWFNVNRGPGEANDAIRNETKGIMAALGADSYGGIPQGNTTYQNAGRHLSKIHPPSIKNTAYDGTIFLNFDICKKTGNYVNSLPEEAKYIWGALRYIEGFTYLIPGALHGSKDDLNMAKELINESLIFCPNESYIKEALEKITEIETALAECNRKKHAKNVRKKNIRRYFIAAAVIACFSIIICNDNKISNIPSKPKEKQKIIIVSTEGVLYTVVKNNAVHVRIRPSKSSDIIGIVNIRKGDTISVLEKRSDWLKIKVKADRKESFGWIHKNFFVSKDDNSKAVGRNKTPSRTSIAHINILDDYITSIIRDNKPVKPITVKVSYKPPIFYYCTYEGAVPNKTTAQIKLYDNETLLWESTNFTLAHPSGYFWTPIGYNFTKVNFPFYKVKLFIDGEQKRQIKASVFPQ